MKTVKLIIIALFVLAQAGKAQQKAVDKIVIKTPMAVCDACKDRIEHYISQQDGVTSVDVDIKKHTTTIVYITDRINDENLKTLLADLGFDADDVTAEVTAVTRLPKCCQKTLTAQDSTQLIKRRE